MKNLIFILVILFGSEICFAQEHPITSKLNSTKQNSLLHELLEDVDKGISEAEISSISPLLASQVYLSFLNGISGYYSSNQAYYVLEKFLNEYKVISFKFDKIKIDTMTPFATGIYYYEHKGNRSEAKVYLTLKLATNSWQITQISID